MEECPVGRLHHQEPQDKIIIIIIGYGSSLRLIDHQADQVQVVLKCSPYLLLSKETEVELSDMQVYNSVVKTKNERQW